MFKTQPATTAAQLAALLVLLTITACVTLLFMLDFSDLTYLPGCPVKTLTGLNCPGCGSTRALHQLIHLHPLNAWNYNPALIVLGIPAMILLLVDLAGTICIRKRIIFKVGNRTGSMLAPLILIYFLVRNLFHF